VAGWKYRACIVELDTHSVTFFCDKQRRHFVPIAMRKVEYPIADTQ
jgi:hypothetical protein